MPGLGVSWTLSEPFYEGGSSSSEVPGLFDVAIDGRGYMIDWESDRYRHQSIQLIRQQADTSDTPGEHTVNPEDFWRRSMDSWHQGAGQPYLDHPDSVSERFNASVGVDCWTEGQLSLLPDVAEKTGTATTNDIICVAGERLYWLTANTPQFTSDITVGIPTFTTVTPAGTALASPVSMTSDGTNVYIADGTDLYYTTTSVAAYTTATGGGGGALPADVVRYCKGRLMRGNNDLWAEYTGTLGAMVSTTIYDHRNAAFRWVDFVGGANHIYAAGFSGDKSLIYKSTVLADATALAAPSVAAELPDGEIVRSLGYYLGFVFIGTDNGVRFAVADTEGNLTIGDLIETGSPVRCFEGQGRFVWFGWDSYTFAGTNYAGLGRMDLKTFNGSAPAYATDMMRPTVTADRITSVVTFQDLRVFSQILGGTAAIVYAQDTVKATSGMVTSGNITYGLTEPKMALYLDSAHAAGAGSYQAALSVDGAAYSDVGGEVVTTAEAGRQTTTVGQTEGELFQVRYTLERDATDTTSGPVLHRFTLKADPQASRRAKRSLPLLLHREVIAKNGSFVPMDVGFERAQLLALWAERTPFALQEGDESTSVILDDFEWIPYRNEGFSDYGNEGTFVALFKEI